ncbi:MAG: hypothetical protein WAS54_10655 [Scrofimicrobium sp.]
MIEIPVVVKGLDLDDEKAEAALIDTLETFLVSESDSGTVLSFYVDAEDFALEVEEKVVALQAILPGISLVRLAPDLVNASDIARRVGVSREAARKWSKQEGFPLPFGGVGDGKRSAWRWVDVVGWLKDEKGLKMDGELLSPSQMDQLNYFLSTMSGLRGRSSWGVLRTILASDNYAKAPIHARRVYRATEPRVVETSSTDFVVAA